MIPFMIVVTCLQLTGCESPDLGANNYTTRADCERAMKGIYEKWMPKKNPHAYSFRCRPFPW